MGRRIDGSAVVVSFHANAKGTYFETREVAVYSNREDSMFSEDDPLNQARKESHALTSEANDKEGQPAEKEYFSMADFYTD